jgi:hypothetical protein
VRLKEGRDALSMIHLYGRRRRAGASPRVSS